MLTKYELVNVPDGGVDHFISGQRVRINQNLTDEQAEQLITAGLPYFQPKTTITDGQESHHRHPETSPGKSDSYRAGKRGPGSRKSGSRRTTATRASDPTNTGAADV